ncbi:hypothetical protein KUH03_15065 [Sphingobacterium sp. E70]|uniref:hypothetical protein n=1 Tax=Sphingobacterium sp. E70 TaxID=2853439 RepID=UPI00211C0EFF|nr:hypothetical protein [Sphingobacterium sp. E70]ULT27842.1 hypothetical protein KUH03_15065 [Sphingobacterium sp. E70]
MMKPKTLFIIIFATILPAMGFGQFKVTPLGNTIYEGVFTGNGLLGTMTYLSGKKSVRIDIGRTDVYDHRANSEDKLFDKARLQLGHFDLDLGSAIVQSRGYPSKGGLCHGNCFDRSGTDQSENDNTFQ